jgi:hypothetical protein
MSQLSIVTIKNPLLRNVRDIEKRDFSGQSLQEIVLMHVPEDLAIKVTLDGNIIPKDQRLSVIPQEHQIITIIPLIEGGDDDGKGIINGVIMIAIMVAAMVVLGPGAGSFVGYGLEGAWLAGAVGVVTMAGGLALQALTPPPKEDNSVGQGFGASQSYGWQPQTTQQQGLPWPLIYGKTLTHGNIISAFTEPYSDNNKQVVNFLTGVGLGPLKSITNIKLNEQPIENYNEVTSVIRYGLMDQSVTEKFNQTKIEHAVGVVIKYGDDHEFTTVNADFDSLEVDISFPRGIFKLNSAGKPGPFEVIVGIDYRLNGDSAWIPLHAGAEKLINRVARISTSPKRLKVWTTEKTYFNKGDTIIISGLGGLGGVNGNEYEIDKRYNDSTYRINVDLEDSSVTGLAELEALPGPPAQYSADYDVDYATYRAAQDAFIDGGTISTEVDIVAERRAAAIGRTYKIPDLVYGNKYDVRVSKYSEEKLLNDKYNPTDPNPKYGQNMTFSILREVVDDSFEYPRQALIGVRALATDQISGSIDLSAEVEGRYVRTYNGTYWGVEYSNNPAWVLFDILSQPVLTGSVDYAPTASPPANAFTVNRYDGMNPSKLDEVSFLALATYCDELVGPSGDTSKRITFNGMFNQKTNLWDAALRVAEIARCMPIWDGNKLYLAIDKDTEPSAIYGMPNIEDGSFKETFIPLVDRATEFDISYMDEDRNWEKTPFTIFDNSVTGEPRNISLNLFGITNSTEAWRNGMFRLRQNQLLIRTLSFDVSIEALGVVIGDVFIFQHDVPEWSKAGRTTTGSGAGILITDVLASDSLDVDLPKKIWVKHLADDSIESRTVSSVTSNEYYQIHVTPNFNTTPAVDDMWIFGDTASVDKEYRVTNIVRSSDLTVTIQAIEYNEAIYNDDDLDSPAPAPTAYVNLDINVTNLTLTENSSIQHDGSIDRWIDVTYDIPRTERWDHAEIYLRIEGEASWQKLGETASSYFRIDRVTSGITYEVTVVSYSVLGRRSAFSSSPSESITISGDATYDGKPLEVRITGLQLQGLANTAEFTGKDIKFEWNQPQIGEEVDVGAGEEPGGAGATTPNLWLRDYEVVIKDAVGDIRRAVYVPEEHFVYTYEMNVEDGSGTPERAITIEVRVRDTHGRTSVQPAILDVNNPSPAAPTGVTLTGTNEAIRVAWDSVVDTDLQGYKVWVSTSPGFSPGDGTLEYTGPNTYFEYIVTDTTTYYFVVAAYDAFGITGLNYAVEDSSAGTIVTGALTWLGAWVGATDYVVGPPADAVAHNGNSFVCTQDHNSTTTPAAEPGVGGSWEDYWDYLATKGNAGTNGTNGTDGDDGDDGADAQIIAHTVQLTPSGGPPTTTITYSAGDDEVVYYADGTSDTLIGATSGTIGSTPTTTWIYHVKGSTTLVFTTSAAAAMDPTKTIIGVATKNSDGVYVQAWGGSIANTIVAADHILASNLSAISADIGTITAGLIQNAAATNVFDVAAGTLSIDGTGAFADYVLVLGNRDNDAPALIGYDDDDEITMICSVFGVDIQSNKAATTVQLGAIGDTSPYPQVGIYSKSQVTTHIEYVGFYAADKTTTPLHFIDFDTHPASPNYEIKGMDLTGCDMDATSTVPTAALTDKAKLSMSKTGTYEGHATVDVEIDVGFDIEFLVVKNVDSDVASEQLMLMSIGAADKVWEPNTGDMKTDAILGLKTGDNQSFIAVAASAACQSGETYYYHASGTAT